MNELLGIDVAQGGVVALVTFFVLLIYLGRLVPRSVVDDIRKDRDDRVAEIIAERDTWREAHQVSEKARLEAQAQAGELLELSRTSVRVLSAIRGEVPGDAMDQSVAAPPS